MCGSTKMKTLKNRCNTGCWVWFVEYGIIRKEVKSRPSNTIWAKIRELFLINIFNIFCAKSISSFSYHIFINNEANNYHFSTTLDQKTPQLPGDDASAASTSAAQPRGTGGARPRWVLLAALGGAPCRGATRSTHGVGLRGLLDRAVRRGGCHLDGRCEVPYEDLEVYFLFSKWSFEWWFIRYKLKESESRHVESPCFPRKRLSCMQIKRTKPSSVIETQSGAIRFPSSCGRPEEPGKARLRARNTWIVDLENRPPQIVQKKHVEIGFGNPFFWSKLRSIQKQEWKVMISK